MALVWRLPGHSAGKFARAAVVSAAMALAAATAALGQPQTQPIVRIDPPEIEVALGEAQSAETAVDVVVEGVENLGAFQFTLAYDEEVLDLIGVTRGSFLTETGREAVCPDPLPEEGRVEFRCVTLGEEPPGPDGAGVLASVQLSAEAGGDSALDLEDVVITTIAGRPIPSVVEGGAIKVLGSGDGFSWVIWGPVGGVLAALVLAGGAFLAARTLRRA